MTQQTAEGAAHVRWLRAMKWAEAQYEMDMDGAYWHGLVFGTIAGAAAMAVVFALSLRALA